MGRGGRIVAALRGIAELREQRSGVERLVAEPRRDLLAQWPRPFAEQRTQALAGLPAAPPVLAELAEQRRKSRASRKTVASAFAVASSSGSPKCSACQPGSREIASRMYE